MTDSNCCFSMLKELVDPNYKNIPFLTTMTRDNNIRNTRDSFGFICKGFETTCAKSTRQESNRADPNASVAMVMDV